MTCIGHVKNGVVVLENSTILPEGTEVEVTVRQNGRAAKGRGTTPGTTEAQCPSVEDQIADIVADVPAGQWDRLPTDLNEQLDHYVYGTPRR